jgi:hypothetical protein
MICSWQDLGLGQFEKIGGDEQVGIDVIGIQSVT